MRKRTLIFFAPIVIFLFSGWFETSTGLNQKGNKNYKDKRYETALDAYRKAQVQKPDQPETRYNLGTTLYQMDEFQEAEGNLAKAIQNAKTKELKAQAWYNYGNTQYRLGQFEKAIDAYRKALELNPEDKDAKFNLELLQKKKGLFENKQNQRDKENQKKPPQQQNKNQQQQRQQQQKNQGGGGDQQDKNQQGQGNQGEGQGQDKKEEQEEKSQDEKEGGQNQKDMPQKRQEQGGGEEEKQEGEKQEQGKQEEGEDEGDQKQNQPGQEITPMSISPLDQSGAKPDETAQGPQKALLQGQMSREQAYHILDALKTSEQQIQILRRPSKPQKEHTPEKDW